MHPFKKKIFSIRTLKKNSLVKCNGYQSEYAKNFLEKKGFENLTSLKDYINADYKFNNSIVKNKKDIVLYNPKKGIKFTKKLIKRSPALNWIPIQNMTRSQVKSIMLSAKLYIDFGYHPGKDRMPREAAMSGCCIITGKQGSAGFYGDIPIDEDLYKYNQKNKDINIIIEKIRFVLLNYENCILDFEFYRKRISHEKQEFENDVVTLLCID